MSNSFAIARIENVSKRFVMHKEKTAKERLLNFKNSRSSKEDFWALSDINLEIEAGKTVGLVGHNGSGKSTLLKIIGGIIEPTRGQVLRRGRIAPLLELGAGFHPDLTGRENIFLNAAILGLTKTETERHFDAIVDFSGIESFIDTQVKFYSSGMYVRLAFSIAVHVDPDFLLVDEVLAVGDQPFQQKCMSKISEFQKDGRTIALVSHSAAQISSLCDSVVVLENGRMLHNGETEQGLRILRSGYARMQQQQSGIGEDGVLPALEVGDISVTVLESLDRNGLSLNSLIVDLPISINSEIPAWEMGISIWTTGDQRLFSLNSTDIGLSLPNKPLSGVVSFNIPDVPLNAGSYGLSFGAITDSGTVLDSRNPATTFEVSASGVNQGPVRIDYTGELRLS